MTSTPLPSGSKWFLAVFCAVLANGPFFRPLAQTAVTETPPAAAAAPAASPPPAASQRNIRFQFDGIPYADVLERFAQMADKPLVTSTNLQGTLTFSDSQPYNYQEALETLNVILAMKGMMLMEDGRYLRVVPFKQLPQMPLKILRGVDQTGDVRPGEIVTVVLPVKNLDSKEVADAVSSMLSNAGSIAPLSRGRGLIITDRLETIRRVRSLLAAIDTETASDRQMKAFTLLHSSGSVVSDLINRTFGVATAPKRTQYNTQSKQLDVLPPDPNDYITAVYEEASRTMVLFGPTDRIALAEQLISKFEDKAEGAAEVRIYYPQVTKAEELAQTIRQAIPTVAAPNQPAATAGSKVRIIVDSAQNRLIVAAPVASQLDEIELLINKLDKPVHGTGGTFQGTRSQTIQITRLLRPHNADARNVAKILSEALSRQTREGVRIPTASVSVETNTQSVIVTGSPGDVQTAVDIVSQLETGGVTATPQKTQFFDVGGGSEARRLMPLIEQIYRAQVTDSLTGDFPNAKILPDSETGKLIITASESHLKRIEEIVRQLTTEKTAAKARPLRTVALQQVRVDAIMSSVTSLLAERMKEKRFADLLAPAVSADTVNNRLLVTATDDQFKEVEAIVKTVDVLPQMTARQMALVPIQSKTAAELITLTTQLLAQLAQEQPNPQLAPKLIPDPSGKQLIVLATAKDMVQITNFVRQLDNPTIAARQFKGVELRGREAGELTPFVQQLYLEQLKSQPDPSGGPATLLADPKNNRILVSGSEKEIARVEMLIRTLDPEQAQGRKDETRVVRLKSAIAAELSSLVEKSLGARAQHVKVLVDTRSNSLVLTGESSAVEAAAQVIEQLDTRSDATPRDLRIVELKQGEAAALAPMVTSLASEMLKDQRGPSYVLQSKIVADPSANRLVVSGPKEELTAISKVIDVLNQTPETAGGARVFKLNLADAATVAMVVSNAMIKFDSYNRPLHRVSVSADKESNTVVISGTRADLQDAQTIIEKLDTEGTETTRILKLIDVRGQDADAMATLAMRVFSAQNNGRSPTNLVSVTPEPSGKRLIVLAPASMLAQIETVITALDHPEQSARELQAIELKSGNAADLLPTINRIYSEQSKGKSQSPASIYPGGSDTRLMVYGTKEQAGSIRQIVETLETDKKAPRATKIIEVGKLADAQRILPLAQQLYRDQARNNPDQGTPDAQMISDGRTGRIIVSARQSQLAQIEEIITGLQVNAKPEPGGRETRAFDVGSPADVQRLLPLIRQLYEDQWKDKNETDPADAQIVADPPTGRLIITGKPAHLKQIEAIVNQLKSGKPSADLRDTRVFDLTMANAVELSTTVRSLYQDQARDRLGTRVNDLLILPDVSANRIIVSGESNELAVVEEIVKKLDKASSQSASTRVFKLKSADPDKVLEIVTAALVRYDAYGRTQKRVSVVMEPKSRSLIAVGDPKDLQGAAVIIEQLDMIGAQPERKMKVIPLKSGRAARVTAQLTRLYQDQAKSQPDLGVADALILEDATSNQIILAGSEAQLQLIEQILAKLLESGLDQIQRETRIFEIGAADEVSRLQGLVQGLYTEAWKGKEAADPADAQILADAQKGRLIVTGKTNHVAEIEALLNKLRAPLLSNDLRETRVYELNTTTAADMSATLKTLYQEHLKAHPVAPMNQAVILPDPSANRLIVAGITNELAVIDEIVHKLDKTEFQTGRMRVFKLKTAEADQLASVLSSSLSQISSSGRIIPRVTVGSDRQNNILIVSGDPRDLQAAALIVEQMDTILAKEPRQMRIIPIKNGSPVQLATRLRTLYEEQMKGQPKNGAADPLIMGDDPGGRLIITGTETHSKIIEEILGKLQETADLSARQLRVFTLQHNSAASIATIMAQLFARQTGTQDINERLIVTAAPDDRTLVVQAPAGTMTRAAELVESLDGEKSAGLTQVRTYQLPEGNASELAAVLARLFVEKAGKAPAPNAPRFEADATANVLIVAATPDQFIQIDKLIEDLKKTARVASEIRTFKLRNADPSQVVEVLETLLNDNEPIPPGQNRPRRQQSRAGVGFSALPEVKSIRIAPAISLNSVVVQGPPEKIALAEKLIQTLDSGEADGKTVIQTVHLKKAIAENLADAVNKTIAGRDQQSRMRKVTVTPVIGPNSLLINGPADAVQDVMGVIRELDQESEDAEIKVHIYKLENGNVREVSAVIQQLLQNLSRSQVRNRTSSDGPRQPQATVSTDERSNSLVIAGNASHFKLVEQVLKTLDRTPDKAERDVQFVWLRNAKAFDVSLKLEAVFAGRTERERPVIESDSFNNSLTIIGKRSDIAQIQELVARLDESTKDTSLQVRLRPLDRVPVEQMAKMLENIYPQMSAGKLHFVEKLPPAAARTNQPPRNTNASPSTVEKVEEKPNEVIIAVDKSANALILSGPAQELDQVDRIMSELSMNYISSDAEFRVFPLKEADPVVVSRTLTDLFKPEPVNVQPPPPGQGQNRTEVRVVAPTPKLTVVSEPRTRSVIIRAKANDFTLLESLIKQLDVAGLSSQLEFRLVPLTNTLPVKVLPLIQQMVTQLNLVRPGEPLTVSADARTRGVLVIGRETVISQVERMIHTLDTPASYAESEVLVIALKKASAPQLAAVLQNMLKPPATEQTPDAHELQEQIRSLRIKDENGRDVVLDLTKPIRVMADPVGGGQGGNRLILSSTPDNLRALAAVVEMMDAVSLTEGIDFKIVQLQNADAASVSQTLTTVFAEGRRLVTTPAGRGEPEAGSGKALSNPVNVAVDARSNSLILSGRKESLDLAEKIIQDLDRKVERFVTEVRLFRMKHASAMRLAPLLQSVFAEGPAVPGTEGLTTQITRLRAAMPAELVKTTEQAKARSALIVQGDDTSNIIVVAARADSMPLIESVINQLDIPSASGLDTIRVYALKHADAVNLQKVVNDLFSGPRAAVLRNEDKPNITIDARTQALIVAGNGKSFGIIESLLVQLDRDLPLELRDVQIIPLEHADAPEVAASLQRLLDARVKQKAVLSREQADAMQVLVIPEPRSNSLLVTGSKDSFELVEELAKALDKAPTALSGQIRIVPLVYADARVVSSSVLSLFTQRYQASKSPETQRNKPVIVPDPRSNSLMIAAGVDDNATIDGLLQKLDRKLDDPALKLAFLPLRHNDAARVATTLEAIFTARLKARTVTGQPASPQDEVKIETDSLNNSLVVSANKDNLETIAELLEKIDAEPEIAGGVIQTFTLQYADAQRVATMLRTLVQQGLYRPGASATTRGQGQGQSSRQAMAVTVDPRSNTLIVSASPENLLVVREVIRQVDSKELAELGNIRLYTLKHARASTLSTVLDQFFRARRTGEGGQGQAGGPDRSLQVAIVPDDRVNTLLVTATKESFDVIDRIISQLDAEDTLSRMNFRVFPLKQATAAKLQSTLQRLFVNRPPRAKGEPLDPITIVADGWVNALIVGAAVDDMAMVSSLIERLDSEEAQLGITVQVLPLAKGDARRIAQTVQALYRDGATTTGTAAPVLVSADERINAIVVSAGEADLKRIAELVKKLDTDQVARISEIRVFPLRFARADSLSTILNAALNTKPAASTTDPSPNSASLLQFITRSQDGQQLVASALKEGVLITPDGRMNSLIVSAPVDYMGLLEQIVSSLDLSSPQQAKIKVFNLENADARQMAELLMSLFRLQPATGLAGAGSPRAIQYTLIRKKPAPGSIDEFEDEAGASAVVGSDEQSALHVTIDPRTNSLLVGGTEHYVALVAEIIQTLDSSSAQERKTEVYHLKNAQATELQVAVRTFLDMERTRITQVLGQDAIGTAQRLLEREVGIVAESASNTLLLSANPRYFDQLKELIEQLDQPLPQVLIQVLLAEVTLDSTHDLGIEWNVTKAVQNAQIVTGTGLSPASLGLGVANDLKSFGGFSSAVTGSDYGFLLRALENDGRLSVLSRPQILTSDNKPASINIGQRVPLITDSRVTERGDTINSFQYQNVGVNLAVTPRIGADGSVKMEVSTTNSSLSSSSIDINANAKIPIINERRAQTSVSVQSGQSIIIGGLISSSEDTRTKKVPYLGDIPYLGALFRNKTQTKDRKELLILLTPQVLITGKTVAKKGDPEAFTREELDKSNLRDSFKDSEVRKRLLDPLYPGLRQENSEKNEKPARKDKSGEIL